MPLLVAAELVVWKLQDKMLPKYIPRALGVLQVVAVGIAEKVTLSRTQLGGEYRGSPSVDRNGRGPMYPLI